MSFVPEAPGRDAAASHHSRSSTASAASYFPSPISSAVSGLLRRLSAETESRKGSVESSTHSLDASMANTSIDGVYTPPRRHPSPFQPPPLTPLTLDGWRTNTPQSARLLSKALAEEIRLLMPARLQLVDNWSLAYSLEQNGVSLATLYEKAEHYRGKRGGYVLVVRDGNGNLFGAYLSDAPHPGAHFYGTGECFLWRAAVLPSIPSLSSLPPPPSSDTTNAQRTTTLSQPKSTLSPPSNGAPKSGTSTPEMIRFKAFPYSGVNDYLIFCQQEFFSIGGGDGHYGLWLDDNLERGVSSTCPTFGNEPLSEEGNKFDVLGVELWYVGA
ncbi:hypothetical protein BDY21DRAFT_386236 [Lineolata rhizophorae]|uniref:Oxidation resistance protein 1 n=1 Tax=Lineolata rhizophorae TaxID=578093 RepID=A0A6A6NYM3_9PEZI|nr:hypothetical protein BDY21DRAFT_386236 [Lineolata rhizophorae]